MSARRGMSRAGVLRSLAVVVSSVLAATVLVLTTPARSEAADLPPSILEGGFIISDAAFFDGDAMTAAQIQTFLNGKVPTCTATTGPTCLKNFRATIPAKAADQYCKAMPARTNTTAAQIIADAALACNISPKVILVILQKEQGLVMRTAPTDWNYRAAMGQSCPDTAPCSEAAAGFVNQVRLGARQQQVYRLNPSLFNYKPGQVNTIKWHPSASCGTSKVYIQNQATANLYIYTPYRPNVAALAAGSGTGDSCSSYGNRNFYNYYVDWFAPDVTRAPVPACQVPPAGDIAARSGTATVTTANLNARTAPTLKCTSGLTVLHQGASVTVTGAYGMWTRATYAGKTVWLATEYLSTTGGAPAGSGNVCAVPATSSITSAPAWAIVTTSVLNARLAPSTSCATGAIQISQGQVYERTATYGAWWRLVINGKAYWAHSDYLSTTTPKPAATRISGADRYETSALVSKKAFPNGASTVYLATGADFADALAAAPLAAEQGASLLLTSRNALPAVIAAELKRLAPTRVVLVGGAAVLGDALIPGVRDAVGSAITVDRVAGADRYETSRKLATAGGAASTVYLATGRGFADALGAAAVAGAQKVPVVLVDGSAASVGSATRALLTSLGATNAVIVGGESAVSRGIATELAGAGLAVVRRGGVDRYATNAALNAAAFPSTAAAAVVATGRDFPDALTGSVLAAVGGQPLLVTNSTCVSSSIVGFVATRGTTSMTLIGGERVLSARVAQFQRC